MPFTTYQAMLGVDESSSITLTGSGSFAPGRQIYDYYTSHYAPKDYGASAVIRVEMPQVSSDHALNIQKVREIAENVSIERTQLLQHPGADWVVAVRRNEDDPFYTYAVDIFGSLSDQLEDVMILPENLEMIDTSAFEGCTGAEAIVIPESVCFIGDDAFEHCPDAVLFVVPGSYAHEYALEHGMAFSFASTN